MTDGLRLTPKQSNIFAWGWQPNARFRYGVCGRRFGKTFLASAEIRRAARLAVEHNVSPDDEIWFGSPTFKQAKRVFWSRMKRAIPRSWVRSINETECYITMKTGHVLRIVGLDNYENLRGSGLWFFVGDEWADCPPQAWDEVVRPMLSTAQGHALFIGTPKGYNHFYDGYISGLPDGDPETKSWLYTTLDGGNVPEHEVERAKRELDPRSFRQEYCATFESFGGRVYYGFDRQISVKKCPLNLSLDLHIGMDFNVNPMTAVVFQVQPDGPNKDQVWQVAEHQIPSSNTHEMCNELRRHYGRMNLLPEHQLQHIHVYPDPAGAQRRTSAQGETDIGILRKAGFTVLAMSSHPQVRDRINVVNMLFLNAADERRLFIDTGCKKSIESYERLSYKEGTSDPDKSQTYLSDNTVTLDHVADAAGYFIYTRFGKSPTRAMHIPFMGR